MNYSFNERSLNHTVDMVRMCSILLLLLHFYFYCYDVFVTWGLASSLSDRFLQGLARTGVFRTFHTAKFYVLGLLAISLLGAKGRKMEKLRYVFPLACLLAGLALYFGSALIFKLELDRATITIAYMITTTAGYASIFTGSGLLSRILKDRLSKDIFNTCNETFPQETRRIDTAHSINLPYRFRDRRKHQKGWLNLNTVRGTLICASSGAGKSWYVIQHIIRQHIKKKHAMFIYDFKYADLTTLAYNYYLRYRSDYPAPPKFYSVNFDDPSRTHRCNAIAPEIMTDIVDASEAARSILLGLNTEWISKQGDFWVESAISFLTALIWYLRKFENGKYCTLAHVIELSQVSYNKLFSILRAEPDIQNNLSPFLSAYLDNIKDTVGNQITSFKIAMARLSSPALYYVISGNDFTLDINDPKEPKIVCMGNNPQRSGIYGSVISLYVSTLNRLVNKKGMINTSEVYDEAPTIYNHMLPQVLSTGRSNGISVTLCIQSLSQMRVNYGKNLADVLFELPANKIFGQQTGDGAKHASEMIGRVLQEKQSIQTNSSETSITQSTQLDPAVPVSRIAMLSAGEFVGLVADDPDNPVPLKAFHGHIVQDNKTLAKEHAEFKPLPLVRAVSPTEVGQNFARIREETIAFVDEEIKRMLKTASLADLVIANID